MSDLGLEDEGVVVVVKVLIEGVFWVMIFEFGGNEIIEKVVLVLVICICFMKYLIRLNLMENELKDKGVVIVFNVIKDGFDNLCELDLSVNEIGCIGVVVVV